MHTSFIRGALIALVLFLSVAFATKAVGHTNEAIFGQLSQSVVKLTNLDATAGGTAFLAQAPGKAFLVTNWHVCGEATNGYMLAVRQGDFELHVRVLKEIPKSDICLLEATPGRAVQLGKAPERLQPLYTLGHPGLLPQVPRTGNMIGVSVVPLAFPLYSGCKEGFTQQVIEGMFTVCVQTMRLIDTTIPSAPGASGSPVVDSAGALVGVINSTRQTIDGLHGAMISVDELRGILDDAS